jgi:hypothetical protein
MIQCCNEYYIKYINSNGTFNYDKMFGIRVYEKILLHSNLSTGMFYYLMTEKLKNVCTCDIHKENNYSR